MWLLFYGYHYWVGDGRRRIARREGSRGVWSRYSIWDCLRPYSIAQPPTVRSKSISEFVFCQTRVSGIDLWDYDSSACRRWCLDFMSDIWVALSAMIAIWLSTIQRPRTSRPSLIRAENGKLLGYRDITWSIIQRREILVPLGLAWPIISLASMILLGQRWSDENGRLHDHWSLDWSELKMGDPWPLGSAWSRPKVVEYIDYGDLLVQDREAGITWPLVPVLIRTGTEKGSGIISIPRALQALFKPTELSARG